MNGLNTKENIETLIKAAPEIKIAVIGDLIIDEYWHGTVDRISPEAPVMVLNQTSVTRTMGGAGNVYRNLKSLGANVALYCNYPDNEDKIWDPGDAVVTNNYPCSRKVRMVAGNTQLLRVDVETPYDQIEWPQFNDFSWWRELMDNFEWFDVIVLSDYSKGVLSDGVINTLIEFAKISKKTIVVDAKRDLFRYVSDDVILKCNRKEWMESKIFRGVKGLVITNGENGMSVQIGGVQENLRGHTVNMIDVCGAGDTVTAVLALGVGAGMYLLNAGNVANLAAAEVCRHPGVVPANWDWIMQAYEQTQESVNP